MPGLASVDGAISEVEEARIPITDEGLLRGDGVFEVIRLYEGRPFALDDHLARMTRSAENLRLPFDADAVRADAEALLAAASGALEADAKLRLVVTRGGRRLAIIEPLPPAAESISLGLVEYAPLRTLDGVKSLSYAANMLATRLAKERGFDEALLTTPHGRLLEAPTSTFFYVLDGGLCTPPLSDHVLDSITRRRVLAVADVRERPVSREELDDLEEAFLASTTREVQPIHRIEHRELRGGGPVTQDVARKVAERIRSELSG
jgi:branched-chain amino acid aminotransferase